MKSSKKKYRVILRKESEGVYTAIVPALPRCITWGESVEHAMEMAKKAIKNYIKVLQSEDEPIPDDNETIEYSLELTV